MTELTNLSVQVYAEHEHLSPEFSYITSVWTEQAGAAIFLQWAGFICRG